jgi:hypothetical protein
MMVVNPRLVVKITADTRLLVVAGSPTDENGRHNAGTPRRAACCSTPSCRAKALVRPRRRARRHLDRFSRRAGDVQVSNSAPTT